MWKGRICSTCFIQMRRSSFNSIIAVYNLFVFAQVELTFKEKVYIVEQIAQALVFMHGFDPPIVHLDMKPENVLVNINFASVCTHFI